MEERGPGRPRRYRGARRTTSVILTEALLDAINTVRGKQSAGEFIEAWLRTHPQVAEHLAQQQKEAK